MVWHGITSGRLAPCGPTATVPPGRVSGAHGGLHASSLGLLLSLNVIFVFLALSYGTLLTFNSFKSSSLSQLLVIPSRHELNYIIINRKFLERRNSPLTRHRTLLEPHQIIYVKDLLGTLFLEQGNHASMSARNLTIEFDY